MKRKRADRQDWQRVTKRRFAMISLETEGFRGYVSLFCIDEVNEPLLIKAGGELVCLADNGYSWLQHFPQGTRYALTTIFNAQGELTRWYLDICKQHGCDEQGMVWYDDLYLDLDIAPNGTIHILDADELDAAWRQGAISSFEYDLAWLELNSVMTAIEADMFPLLWRGEEERKKLLTLVQPGGGGITRDRESSFKVTRENDH
jgi:predicted RNA-binding protein associated with RNAse of E/G family